MSLSSERMLKLMAYADGELQGSERLEVETWLASDVDAVRFANELAGLGELVKTGHGASPAAKAIAGFNIADSVMAAVAKQEKQAPVISLEARRRQKIGVAVAAALALAASVFVMTRSKEEVPMARAPVAPAPAVAAAEPGVDVDVDESEGESVRVFYLANESSPTTSVVVWVDEPGGK